jgi:hypothetical protein
MDCPQQGAGISRDYGVRSFKGLWGQLFDFWCEIGGFILSSHCRHKATLGPDTLPTDPLFLTLSVTLPFPDG